MKRFVVPLIMAFGFMGLSGQTETVSPEQLGAYHSKLAQLVDNYQQELGFLQDPFITAFDQDTANEVYNRLMRRSEGFFCSNSPLFRIQSELKNLTSPNFNQQLVEDIINDAQALLGGGAQIHDLQSNLLALTTTQDYLNRFMPYVPHDDPAKDKDEQGEQQKKTEKKDKNKQQKNQHSQKSSQQKKSQQQSDDEPEEYPEFGDDYNPHTKDTAGDGSDGGKTQKKSVIAEVNFVTRYFGTNVFTQIVRNHANRFQKSTRLKDYYASLMNGNAPAQKTMIVRPLGKQQVKLFMPSGYQPATLQLDHARIELDSKGSFDLIMDMPLERVAVSLVEVPRHTLNKMQEDILTEAAGFEPHEWPEQMQCMVLHKYKPGDNVAEVAKAVEKHLANDYLYSRDARPETDPIDVLKAGAFQCDMAAFIMASVLRDYYKIPCRVIGGFRAKIKKVGGAQKSYLVNSKEGHAWVEVFHDGTWNVYDPTPVKKDKQDENQGEQSEFTDVPPPDEQQPQDQNNQDQQQSDQSTDHEKQQDQKSNQADKKSSEDDKKQEDEKKTSGENKKDEDQKSIDVLPELEDSLADLLKKPFKDDNQLRKALLKLLLIEALNPLKPSNEAGSCLTMLKGLFGRFDADKLTVIKDAIDQHKYQHPYLLDWVKDIHYNLFNQSINSTHRDLLRIYRILEYYNSVIDSDIIRQLDAEIMREIVAALQLLQPLKDKAAHDMALLDDIKKNSPDLLWKTLQEMYGLNAIGPNAPTQSLADALRNHKHDDHLLLSSLYPHTNFITDSSMQSGSMLVKTWLRDGQKRGRDLLPTQRIQDWRYAIPTDHQYDLLENIQRGSAFVMAKRKKVVILVPNDNKEAKRITIVGFDVSGSMGGEKGEFTAALLAAFICRALEDVSPSGVHRHTVVAIPFGDKVYDPIPINNSKEALDVIKNHQDLFRNRGEGTEALQEFLMQAMTLIAKAQDAKNPFEIANIILMSDGQANVNYDELAKARQSINRDTPLQMMFAAIGETNEDLKKFALDSKKMGAKDGFYKEFLNDEITKIVNESKNINMKKYDKYFYSSAEANQINPAVDNHLIAISKKLDSLAIQIQSRMSGSGISFKTNLALFANSNTHQREQFKARPLETWIHELRQLMAQKPYAALFQDDHTVNFLINNLVSDFQKITGIAPTDLTHYENEEMVHWLQDPRRVENSKGKS